MYNKDIHHRRSIRLKDYNYANVGLYFITLVCNAREHLFGLIKENKMILNNYGQIAFEKWIETPLIRPNISLHEFIIMPNHIHGIISVDKKSVSDSKGVSQYAPPAPTDSKGVSQYAPTTLTSPSQTLGAIIRGYKGTVTKEINILRNTPQLPVWQRNYYEHIIRDQTAYDKISTYITNNPILWVEDKFFKRV